jgi:hypothetical protein
VIAFGHHWLVESIGANWTGLRYFVLTQRFFHLFIIKILKSIAVLKFLCPNTLLSLPFLLLLPSRLVITTVVDVDATIAEGAVTSVMVILAQRRIVIKSACEPHIGRSYNLALLSLNLWCLRNCHIRHGFLWVNLVNRGDLHEFLNRLCDWVGRILRFLPLNFDCKAVLVVIILDVTFNHCTTKYEAF